MKYTDRVAIITGATGALGNTMAHLLAERKMGLALIDREAGRLETMKSDLALPEAQLMTLTADLLDAQAVRQAASRVAAHFGRIDILLHLVGGWTGGKMLQEAPAEDLAFMLNQHVWTSFHTAQAFLPYLLQNGWGRVVMITSPFAANPVAKGGPYAIGKAGQEALALTLAQEVKGSGVTVNLLQAKTIDAQREKVKTPSEKNAAWTTPEELAAAILYLLSEEAGTVNGAKIPLYGSG